MVNRICLDTSIVIDGKISEMIQKGEIKADEAEGVRVKHISPPIKTTGLKFEKFFDSSTLSVHLKEDVVPLAKKGKPGRFELVKLSSKPLTSDELEEMIKEVSEATRISDE